MAKPCAAPNHKNFPSTQRQLKALFDAVNALNTAVTQLNKTVMTLQMQQARTAQTFTASSDDTEQTSPEQSDTIDAPKRVLH
ncbi:hypothetical protein [Teredinibacter turnerae]|uniref:hypothetical protein n=1 Tax=Teredinibacter turnerae TaxID=2426 RepID=UPI0003703982|nr:hypothetical protein [Teredinibacter turnerae]